MVSIIDCNNFYASCQRSFNPKLMGKPVAVLSNNDGCVIARSNEAKTLGIPMGAAAFEWEKFFEENGVVVLSSNYALYGDMSNRVMSVLGAYSPFQEIYSVDECFMDFSGMKNLTEYSKEMREVVLRGTGIPTSVGIASSKALAKVANKIAKKYADRLDNVHIIDTDEKRVKALKWLPIGDVWGIGGRDAKRLESMGLKTAYDFTQMADINVQRMMGIVGLRLKRDLEGYRTIQYGVGRPKQNIATTRSFDKNYGTYDEMKERITTFSSSCAQKLRRQNCHARVINVFIHTNFFRKELPQYSKSLVVELPFPTSSSIELAYYAELALKKIYRPGYQYKKAGVMVMELTPANVVQGTIFEQSDPRHVKLMAAMDRANASIGAEKIKLGCQDPGRTWKMKQERLTPRYTTRLSEVIRIKNRTP